MYIMSRSNTTLMAVNRPIGPTRKLLAVFASVSRNSRLSAEVASPWRKRSKNSEEHRLPDTNRDGEVEIPEQHRRTGPPVHQEAHAANA